MNLDSISDAADGVTSTTCSFNLKIRAFTHRGLKKLGNEDRISVNAWSSAEDMEGVIAFEASTATGCVCVVADGMGGHSAGATASRIASEFLMDRAFKIDHSDIAYEILVHANEHMHEVMLPETKGMGSTIAGLVLRGTDAIHFNVGDSRIYRVDDDDLTPISTDDVIGFAGMKMSSTLTQVIGGSSRARVVRPHVGTISLKSREKYLICSDGISDLVDDMQVYHALTALGDQDIVRLVECAWAAGAGDNVAAIIIEVL